MINPNHLQHVDLHTYQHVRGEGSGYREIDRGLIAVWGKEAIQFLNGMITNDVATLEDGSEMIAAFPNAQGRLLAIVRVRRVGERFLFESEEATHEKVFNNLFRFTYAGDFHVEDISEKYRYFELFGQTEKIPGCEGEITFGGRPGEGRFIPSDAVSGFRDQLVAMNACRVSDQLYEVLRIEEGIPLYGVDMDETTIVPELGIDGSISYSKGCYVGQEIIARIHFRGHVAKRLTGLLLSSPPYEGGVAEGRGGSLDLELKTHDDKNAGRITSVTVSPKLNKAIALGYVRYDHLAEGTELTADGVEAVVTAVPFLLVS